MRWLHVPMWIDDAVLLATRRQSALHRTYTYCGSLGVVVKGSKTKFMVINCDDVDKQYIDMGDLQIDHYDEYV